MYFSDIIPLFQFVTKCEWNTATNIILVTTLPGILASETHLFCFCYWVYVSAFDFECPVVSTSQLSWLKTCSATSVVFFFTFSTEYVWNGHSGACRGIHMYFMTSVAVRVHVRGGLWLSSFQLISSLREEALVLMFGDFLRLMLMSLSCLSASPLIVTVPMI